MGEADTVCLSLNGSSIWFLASVKDGTIDVSETPEEILEKLSDGKRAHRT
jgi:hypothetical protein